MPSLTKKAWDKIDPVLGSGKTLLENSRWVGCPVPLRCRDFALPIVNVIRIVLPRFPSTGSLLFYQTLSKTNMLISVYFKVSQTQAEPRKTCKLGALQKKLKYFLEKLVLQPFPCAFLLTTFGQIQNCPKNNKQVCHLYIQYFAPNVGGDQQQRLLHFRLCALPILAGELRVHLYTPLPSEFLP